MFKSLSVSILLVGAIGLGVCRAQCAQDFSYSVKAEPGNPGWGVALKTTATPGRFTFELYDLYTGQVVDTQQVFLGKDEERTIFHRVSPSQYVIYVSASQCGKKSAIGGIQGIRVGTE